MEVEMEEPEEPVHAVVIDGSSFTFIDSVGLHALPAVSIRVYLLLRASLCKILISSFAHKMDFAHNFSVDFF